MDNGQRTMNNEQNNGLFNDYTRQGLASKLRVHISHEKLDGIAAAHHHVIALHVKSKALSASLVMVRFQRSRGSASCKSLVKVSLPRNYIRQTYGNIDSDDCCVTLRTNEEYTWQGSV